MKILSKAALTVLLITPVVPVFAACNASMEIRKPDGIYVNHGDGTVTDTQTGLMWQQCSLGQSGAACATGSATAYNWKQALEAAQAANAGAGSFGYSDWRLPSVAELHSLVEEACWSPAINTTLFPATVSVAYWSASPYAGNASYAWYVNFIAGNEDGNYRGSSYRVRLVRGGY